MNLNKKQFYHKKLQQQIPQNLRNITHPTPNQIKSTKKIYIIAICGKAMASLAQLLIQSGYQVCGSDSVFDPPMSNIISNLKIQTYKGYNRQNIIKYKPDIIVVGNTIQSINDQTTYARQNNIPQISLVEALKYFIFVKKKVLVVAGTHGKTTTTGLLAHVLMGCELDVGYLIGGVDRNTLKSAYLGSGEYFIIQGDQYNTSYFDKSPKFINYNVYSAILTSVQLDHVNLYKDFEEYKQAFKYFVQDIPQNGYLIACGDHQDVVDIAKLSKSNISLYGINQRNKQNKQIVQDQYIIKNIRIQNKKQIAQIYHNNNCIGVIKTKLFGTYNMKNCLSVFILAIKLGCNPIQILKNIQTFQGMKRRQQILYQNTYKNQYITIIDDYAHHPTAVFETLQGIRQQYGIRNIVAIFQFSSTSCMKRQFQEFYKNCFDDADYVLLKEFKIPVSIKIGEQLRTKQVGKFINQKRKKQCVFVCENNEQVVKKSMKLIHQNSVFIFMSAKYDQSKDLLIEQLKKR